MTRNQFLKLAGAFVTGATLASAVIVYLASEKLEMTKLFYETKVSQAEGKLASIDRNLAGGGFMQVDHFLLRRGDRNRVPTQSKFYSDDSFYAPEINEWLYQKTTDREFFTSIFGKEAEKQINEITGLGPVHLWRRGPLKPVQNNDAIQNLAPCIYVQRLPVDELTVQLNLESAKNSQPTTLFEGDIIGAMLAETFANVFRRLTFTSDTNASLLNINKVSNVLYSQFLLTLHNVTIDSRTHASYFITLEVIVISTPKNVYTVYDLIPSEEPVLRGSVAAEVTQWLSGFAVFAE